MLVLFIMQNKLVIAIWFLWKIVDTCYMSRKKNSLFTKLIIEYMTGARKHASPMVSFWIDKPVSRSSLLRLSLCCNLVDKRAWGVLNPGMCCWTIQTPTLFKTPIRHYGILETPFKTERKIMTLCNAAIYRILQQYLSLSQKVATLESDLYQNQPLFKTYSCKFYAWSETNEAKKA